MARIYDDVTQLIGNTPLVRLNKLTDIPWRFVSSGGDVLVLPGSVFVVLGAGLKAAMEDTDQPVRELPQRGVVTDLPGAHRVVVGPGAR